MRNASLATSRLPTKAWPSRSSTSGPVFGCQPKWSAWALLSFLSKEATASTKVLWYARTFELLSAHRPLPQRTNTLPATVAPFEISKKKPTSASWTQLFTKTPSRLPTSYQMPFEFGLSITRLSRQVTRWDWLKILTAAG